MGTAHFVSAGGDADEHATTREWYARLVDFHLQTLIEILKYRAAEDDTTREYLAILTYLDQLEGDAKQTLLLSPEFCYWLSDCLRLQEETKLATTAVEQFDRHLQKLPLLTLKYLNAINQSFYVPIVIDTFCDPIGVNWGVQVTGSQTYELVYDDDTRSFILWQGDHCALEIEPDALTDVSAGTGLSADDLRSIRIYRRYFFDRQTEIGDYWHYPITTWKQADYCEADAFRDELVTSVKQSLQVLRDVWPTAADGMSVYARYLALACPKNQLSHNSASHPIYPFIQAVEAPFNSELENLESMIHEVSHCKLNTLMASASLYDNKESDWSFKHAWMSEPRPLRGVLLGGHAFLNVLQLLAHVMDCVSEWADNAHYRFMLRYKEVGGALAEMRKGQLTSEGHEFVEGLEKTYKNLRSYCTRSTF